MELRDVRRVLLHEDLVVGQEPGDERDGERIQRLRGDGVLLSEPLDELVPVARPVHLVAQPDHPAQQRRCAPGSGIRLLRPRKNTPSHAAIRKR